MLYTFLCPVMPILVLIGPFRVGRRSLPYRSLRNRTFRLQIKGVQEQGQLSSVSQQPGEAEKAFDNALKPHLKKDTNGVNDIVHTMEACTTQLRREEASRIFP